VKWRQAQASDGDLVAVPVLTQQALAEMAAEAEAGNEAEAEL
jgi:hypothetical protein